LSRLEPGNRVKGFFTPSRFRKNPRSGWLFRAAGFCEHGALLDYDDCMNKDVVERVITDMLEGVKYQKGISTVLVFDEKGEQVMERKRE